MKRSDAHAGGPHPLKTRNPDLRLRIVRIARILLPISLKCLSPPRTARPSRRWRLRHCQPGAARRVHRNGYSGQGCCR